MLRQLIFILFWIAVINLTAQTDSLNFLKPGDKAPLFSAIDYKNIKIDLKEKIKNGSVILIFYRGTWCPYCNKHLSHLQDSLNQILNKGASVIVITPEVNSSIAKTISKTGATFNIIHDSTYIIMKDYGVKFQVKESTVNKYKLVGIDLEAANGNKENILPVPATFIINKNGIIDFVHFDENYKKRLPVKEILNHI